MAPRSFFVEMQPTIRLATAEDVPAVADLWVEFQREHNRKHLRGPRLTRANRERMVAHLLDLVPLRQLYVLDAGTIGGFAAIVANVPKIDMHYAAANISDLYVTPALRGQGHGKALLKTAIGEIRSRGLHAVTIGVLAGNTRARELYRAMGFLPKQESLILPLDDEFIKFGPESGH